MSGFLEKRTAWVPLVTIYVQIEYITAINYLQWELSHNWFVLLWETDLHHWSVPHVVGGSVVTHMYFRDKCITDMLDDKSHGHAFSGSADSYEAAQAAAWAPILSSVNFVLTRELLFSHYHQSYHIKRLNSGMTSLISKALRWDLVFFKILICLTLFLTKQHARIL